MSKYKLILIAVTCVLSVRALAQDCPFQGPTDSQEILNAIRSTTSCGNASEVAESCAWGSSKDVEFVGAAVKVCMASMVLSQTESGLLSVLEDKCDQKFRNALGTMYIAMNAFCHLDAVKLFSEFKSPLN